MDGVQTGKAVHFRWMRAGSIVQVALLAITTNVWAVPAPPAIIEKLQQGIAQDIIVEFDARAIQSEAAAQRAPYESFDRPSIRAFKAQRYAQLKQRALALLPKDKIKVQRDYGHLPMAFLRVHTEAALRTLLTQRDVAAVYEDLELRATLAHSLPLIGQPTVATAGLTGAGTTVVVIDTGVNYTLSAFGSCTAPSVPASCKVVVAQDVAANDGTLDDASNHGTNVSGIVAGVAPGAKLAVFDVFSGGGASSSDIIWVIDWAIANQAVYNIAAINMSLGNGTKYTAECSGGNPYVTPISDARAAGILSAVSSGNDKFLDGIANPACTPGAVSVGAVYDANYGQIAYTNLCTDTTTAADKVMCFSNSATFLKLLAPGALITAAGMTQAGTSQAAPHVSGAIAVLHAAFATEAPDQTLARLTGNGIPLTDARNGIVTPRLHLLEAARPLTDDFTVAKILSGASGNVQVSSVLASKQSSEPAHAGNNGGASVWFVWTATADGVVTLSTQGSSFNTLLAVYTGSVLNNLVPVAGNDDDGSGGGASSVVFNVIAGTQYFIAVDGFNGATGTVALAWSWQTAPVDEGEIPFLPLWAYGLLALAFPAIAGHRRRVSRK